MKFVGKLHVYLISEVTIKEGILNFQLKKGPVMNDNNSNDELDRNMFGGK